jgi:hypothetical protein
MSDPNCRLLDSMCIFVDAGLGSATCLSVEGDAELSLRYAGIAKVVMQSMTRTLGAVSCLDPGLKFWSRAVRPSSSSRDSLLLPSRSER